MEEIRLLKADDIDVKVKQVTEKGAVLLLYKNARVDMNILDETFGAENWECDYKEIKGNLYCGICVHFEEKFVWKWDCGIESREDDGNEKKGEASDSFKRAGFKWGIGRELYTAPFTFANVPTTSYTDKSGKTAYKLTNQFEKFKVKEIDYIARTISKLVIVDSKGNVVFNMTAKNTPQTAKPQETITNSPKPQISQETPNNSPKCEECQAEVTDKVAKFSKGKYGRVLCYKCQKKPAKTDLEPIEDEGIPF